MKNGGRSACTVGHEFVILNEPLSFLGFQTALNDSPSHRSNPPQLSTDLKISQGVYFGYIRAKESSLTSLDYFIFI